MPEFVANDTNWNVLTSQNLHKRGSLYIDINSKDVAQVSGGDKLPDSTLTMLSVMLVHF